MKRENLGFEVHIMRNWWWAKWDWWTCSACKLQVRNEKHWQIWEPLGFSGNICMDCCTTRECAEKIFPEIKRQRALNRPPPPPPRPAKPEFHSLCREDLKKLLASYVRLLHSKPVLVKEDYEVLEIINKLIGEKE